MFCMVCARACAYAREMRRDGACSCVAYARIKALTPHPHTCCGCGAALFRRAVVVGFKTVLQAKRLRLLLPCAGHVVCGVLSDGSGALRGVASALRRAVPACTRVPPCAARNTTPMCARARAKRHTHNERTNSATVILLEQHRQVRSIQPHLLAQLARDRHELLLAAALERARVLLRLYAGRRASGPYVLCLHNPCRARACVRACVRERARARARARLRARCGVCSGPSEGAPGPRCC